VIHDVPLVKQTCQANKHPLSKNNWLHVDFGNGKNWEHSWTGQLIEGYAFIKGTPILTVKYVDEFGKQSRQNFNYTMNYPKEDDTDGRTEKY
jgi:hypothetical protein